MTRNSAYPCASASVEAEANENLHNQAETRAGGDDCPVGGMLRFQFQSTHNGDPVRGEKVHAVCLDCHGTGVYTSAERKIKSLKALRKEVARWGDYYSPALSEQDNEDVVAYLNTHFYKF